MAQLYANNASSVLATGISATATSLTVASGSGLKFPSPGANDFFLLTLFQFAGGTEVNREVVKCTARVDDTLTIVRAQENTGAGPYLASDTVQMRLTAGTLARMGGAVRGSPMPARAWYGLLRRHPILTCRASRRPISGVVRLVTCTPRA